LVKWLDLLKGKIAACGFKKHHPWNIDSHGARHAIAAAMTEPGSQGILKGLDILFVLLIKGPAIPVKSQNLVYFFLVLDAGYGKHIGVGLQKAKTQVSPIQKAASQGFHADKAHFLFFRRGKDPQTGLGLQKIKGELNCFKLAGLATGNCMVRMVGRKANMPYLPFFLGLKGKLIGSARGQDFFHFAVFAHIVELKKIHIIGFKFFQAFVEFPFTFACIPFYALGGKNHLFPYRQKPLAHHILADALHICRIEKVDSLTYTVSDQGNSLIHAHAGQGNASQAYFGNFKSGFAQFYCVHFYSLECIAAPGFLPGLTVLGKMPARKSMRFVKKAQRQRFRILFYPPLQVFPNNWPMMSQGVID
jgi:hypothetical protein